VKIQFKLTLIGIIITAVVGGGYYFFHLLPQPNLNKAGNAQSDQQFGWKFPVAKFPLAGTKTRQLAYSDIRDPGGVPQGLPVRLKIPVIGVDSTIEDALIAPDGRMDVPAGSVNVAWFALGPYPGRVGSAVIGGHFGIDNGIPKVFYNLNKLRVGDKVYIEDDKDETHAFIVRSTKSFDRNADATSVFTSSDNIAHLNLITCEGIWNQSNNSYPQRLVVFTDAIADEGAVVVKPKLPQTAITAPRSTPTLTPTSTPTLTPTPSASPTIIPNEIVSSSQSKIIPYLNSLYGNFKDGIISSFLILAIFIIAIKIIRR
jgi:LPXTG-site transpeptidase (sortase) family protein